MPFSLSTCYVSIMQASGTPLGSSLNANAGLSTSALLHLITIILKTKGNLLKGATPHHHPVPVTPVPLNRRNQNHSQGAPLTVQELPSPVILKGIATAALTLMGMGFTTETRRNFQTGDHSHRSHNGRYMDLRQQRGFGMMTPHMLMGQPLAWLNSKLWKLRYSG